MIIKTLVRGTEVGLTLPNEDFKVVIHITEHIPGLRIGISLSTKEVKTKKTRIRQNRKLVTDCQNSSRKTLIFYSYTTNRKVETQCNFLKDYGLEESL